MQFGHRKEFLKLTFRAIALRQAPVSRESWSFNPGRTRVCLWKKKKICQVFSVVCLFNATWYLHMSIFDFSFWYFYRCIGEKPCPLTASLCSWMTTVVFLMNWFISLTCHGKGHLHFTTKTIYLVQWIAENNFN